MTFEEQLDRARNTDGYLAALDQSGGSTPKALGAYGVPAGDYVEGEESMYEAVHAMRTRIITSPAFTGDKTLGAILFENTMDRKVEGIPTSDYLWEKKKIIPFLKVDKGLATEENGVQLMKPIPGLDELLKRAKTIGIFGTKMRSVIKLFNVDGIKTIVDQQFKIGKTDCCRRSSPYPRARGRHHQPRQGKDRGDPHQGTPFRSRRPRRRSGHDAQALYPHCREPIQGSYRSSQVRPSRCPLWWLQQG